MKKGFTLIELLAVIVILAIIALIAVPIVLNIIDDSKESSLLRSAEFYLDAAEYAIADAFLYHGGLKNWEYPITPEGDICTKELPCDDDHTLKVEVNGEKPISGTITIQNGNITKVSLLLGDKTIITNSEGELVYYSAPCVISNDKDGNGQADVGDMVTCQSESFYVLGNDGSNIEMLTEKFVSTTGDIKQSDSATSINFTNVTASAEFGEGYYWIEDEVVYNSNCNLYSIIENYVLYLKKLGLKNVKGELLKEKHLLEFVGGCDNSITGSDNLIYICHSTSSFFNNNKEWIFLDKGNYWSGVVHDEKSVFAVQTKETIEVMKFGVYGDEAGQGSNYLRPVIIISSDNF